MKNKNGQLKAAQFPNAFASLASLGPLEVHGDQWIHHAVGCVPVTGQALAIFCQV